MRAVVFHGPNDLRVEDRPEPQLPDGGVIVRTAFVGVCGSDVRTWRHGSSRISGSQVLGHEVSGTIAASDDERYPVGMRVGVRPSAPCLRCSYCLRGRQNLCRNRIALGYDFPGAMSETFSLPVESVNSGCIVPIPDVLPLKFAVLAEPLHTVINGQNQARIGPQDSVLVIGLGSIGTLHAAVAASRGALRVLAVDVRAERAQIAGRVLGPGVAQVLDPETTDTLRTRGGEYGWDVIVLAAGAQAALDLAMSVVAPGGRILAFAGFPPAAPTVSIDMNRLHYQEIELIGSFAGTPASYARAVDWLAHTSIDLKSVVTDVFPLTDPALAFANVEQGHGLKTVMEVQQVP